MFILDNLNTKIFLEEISDWLTVTEKGTKIHLKSPIMQPDILAIYTGNGTDSWHVSLNLFLNDTIDDMAILIGNTAHGIFKLRVNSEKELEILSTNDPIRRIYKYKNIIF